MQSGKVTKNSKCMRQGGGCNRDQKGPKCIHFWDRYPGEYTFLVVGDACVILMTSAPPKLKLRAPFGLPSLVTTLFLSCSEVSKGKAIQTKSIKSLSKVIQTSVAALRLFWLQISHGEAPQNISAKNGSGWPKQSNSNTSPPPKKRTRVVLNLG